MSDPRKQLMFELVVAVATVLGVGCARTEAGTPRGGESDRGTGPTNQDVLNAIEFDEPLVVINGEITAEERRDMANLVRARDARRDRFDTSDIEQFLVEHPGSAWRAALLTNLGILWRTAGRSGRAIGAFQEAWTLSRGERNNQGSAVADRAASEVALLYAQLGRREDLEGILSALRSRPPSGAAAERVAQAAAGLDWMRVHPNRAFRCGIFALRNVLYTLNPSRRDLPPSDSIEASERGSSLRDLVELGERGSERMVAMRRMVGSGFVVPSVVHLRVDHFVTVVGVEASASGERRYVVRDPSVGQDATMSESWLDAETSGFVLVPASLPHPEGWRELSTDEAGNVWGRGVIAMSDPAAFGDRHLLAGCAQSRGMARHNFHTLAAALHVEDTPVWLNPAFGPEVNLRVAYNQADNAASQTPWTTGFGMRWTFNWQSWLTFSDPSTLVQHLAGGGLATFHYSAGVWQPEYETGDTVDAPLGMSSSTINVRSRDGSVDAFVYRSGRWLLSQRADPQGNLVTIAYDAYNRITTITDATGAPLTFHYYTNTITYPLNPDMYLVAWIGTPDGRNASFYYADYGGTTGKILSAIVDMAGITSSFAYTPNDRGADETVLPDGGVSTVPVFDPSFLSSMTTPYGTTVFRTGWGLGTSADPGPHLFRWVEAQSPTGSTERIEFRPISNTSSDCDHLSPCGFGDSSGLIIPDAINRIIEGSSGHVPNRTVAYASLRNSYYWNAVGYARGRSPIGTMDPRFAHVYHWLHRDHASSVASPVLESEVPPGESRIHYWYNQQTSQYYLDSGTAQAVAVARLTTPDGPDVNQLASQTTYTAQGRVRQTVDEAGRARCFTWDSTGGGLLSAHAGRCSATTSETDPTNRLVRLEYDSSGHHLSVRITDPSGGVTRRAYNQRGQVLREIRPDGVGTDYIYSSASVGLPENIDGVAPITEGLLQQVRSPVTPTASAPVATTTFSYFSNGMVQSVTDGEGVTRSYTRDALERVTSVIAPGSRVRTFDYNIRDNLGNSTGALGLEVTRVTEPNGDTTTLTYDGDHRLTRSAVGVNDVVRYSYNTPADGMTPAGFDQVRMSRGSDPTVLARWTLPAAGGAAVSEVGLPAPAFQQRVWAVTRTGASSPVVSYEQHDVLGRVVATTRGADSQTLLYQSDGMLHTVCQGTGCSGVPRTELTYESSAPGAEPHPFQRLSTLQHFGASGSLDYSRSTYYTALGWPGAMKVSAVYESAEGDPTSSSAAFWYDVVGRLAGSVTPTDTLTFNYDTNDRLSNVHSDTYPSQNLVEYIYPTASPAARPSAAQMPLSGCQSTFSYFGDTQDFRSSGRSTISSGIGFPISWLGTQFDLRGRLSAETVHSTQRHFTYNSEGRAMWIDDNELATSTWRYRDFYYDASGNSTGRTDWSSAGTSFWDSFGHDLMDRITIRQRLTAAASTVSYDARGRVTYDGGYYYTWNSEDRLTQVTRASDWAMWQFRYDATGRLRRFQEGGKWRRLVWVAGHLYQEFWGPSETAQYNLVRKYHIDGLTQNGTRYSYERDARGSVVGLLGSGTLQRAWSYDPWGRRSELTTPVGDTTVDSRIGYAGYIYHPETGLYFTPARVYSPALRRWLSRDPLGERDAVDGNNLYAYVAGDPANMVDTDGLFAWWIVPAAIGVGLLIGYTIDARAHDLIFLQEETLHQEQVDAIVHHRAGGPGRNLPDDALADNYYHCMAVCRSRAYGAIAGIGALVGGRWHEMIRWTPDSPGDLQANSCGYQQGGNLPGHQSSQVECAEACSNAAPTIGVGMHSAHLYERDVQGRLP